MKGKNVLILLLFVAQAAVLKAQPAANDTQSGLRSQILNSKPDTLRIKLMLALGDTYLSKDGRNQYNTDTAFKFFSEAIKFCKILNNSTWQNEALIHLGNYYFEVNDLHNGKASFMKAIVSYGKSGDKYSEAQCWNKLGKAMPDSDLNNIPFEIQCFDHALSIFKDLQYSLDAIDAQKNIAECYLKQGKPNEAEKQLLQIIEQYKAAGYKGLQDTYDLLAQINGSKADLHKEFLYRMEAVKSMEAMSDAARSDYYYARLALTYSDMKMYEESSQWILKAIGAIKKKGKYEDLYGDVSLLVFDYIMLNRPAEALKFLEKISREIPPENLAQRVDLNEEFAHCYVTMKQYEKAEQYYLEMMRLYNVTNFNKAFYSTNQQMITDFIYYNQTIANFYVLIKNYKKAGFYYDRILSLPRGSVRPVTLSEIHQMQFKVDSASGNFVSAIQHFELYQNLHDSLFNATKNKQIQELQIQYETDKKDKDIRLKQQDISLLTNKTQLQDVNLKKAGLTRNIIITSAVVLLSLLFMGYRFKQRHNVKLQLQQDEINEHNQQLQVVSAKQQKLIAEKEWLVKEIHHRVKNNLQIVISLLNVQSGYLDNPSALNAIQESRERMEAIALIHQKLYQTDYGTLIKMKSYVGEMVGYLRNFADTGRIRFLLEIDDVSMDVSQAVPLALILNEAITNALKYAFPGDSDGTITIILSGLEKENILLKVMDNGKGFPDNFDFSGNKSLGIQLMKLFSEQLEGELHFENNDGARITLAFKRKLPVDTMSLQSLANMNDEKSI